MKNLIRYLILFFTESGYDKDELVRIRDHFIASIPNEDRLRQINRDSILCALRVTNDFGYWKFVGRWGGNSLTVRTRRVLFYLLYIDKTYRFFRRHEMMYDMFVRIMVAIQGE